MTDKQRDLVVKYLADLSKGVLIAALIGLSTVKLSPWWFSLDVLGALVALWIAYRLEGLDDDAD